MLASSAAIMWGLSAVVAGDVFEVVSPSYVTQFRAVAVAVAFLPMIRRAPSHNLAGSRLALIAFGLTLAAVTFSFYWAVDLLGVGPGSTIQFAGPVLVLVWSRLTQGVHYSTSTWIAAGAAVIGVGLITRAWDATVNPLGLLAGVLAACFFAVYLVLAERLSTRLPAVVVTGYGFAVAAVGLLIAFPVTEFPRDLSPMSWAQLAAIALFGSILPFFMEITAIRWVAAGLVGVIATLEPVVAAAMGWVWLDQALSPVQVVGGVVVVVSVAAVSLFTAAQQKELVPLAP